MSTCEVRWIRSVTVGIAADMQELHQLLLPVNYDDSFFTKLPEEDNGYVNATWLAWSRAFFGMLLPFDYPCYW